MQKFGSALDVTRLLLQVLRKLAEQANVSSLPLSQKTHCLLRCAIVFSTLEMLKRKKTPPSFTLLQCVEKCKIVTAGILETGSANSQLAIFLKLRKTGTSKFRDLKKFQLATSCERSPELLFLPQIITIALETSENFEV